MMHTPKCGSGIDTPQATRPALTFRALTPAPVQVSQPLALTQRDHLPPFPQKLLPVSWTSLPKVRRGLPNIEPESLLLQFILTPHICNTLVVFKR